ncbi:enoyl-CoA hydratase/isomerase family protein [Chelatococcus reniformis]|uniref:Enoyl-CoA hydratase n=1 Tax=Chelatococcus reniformis TaxID=1494448 RepID=A0A916U5I4_9HYPH|nr:enoyl-CoA hydratase/isomerase family protein [Chelatococcus reniformis]GGC61426.1 enoyl-CoA hydratase [Chelatococcus reniformis]
MTASAPCTSDDCEIEWLEGGGIFRITRQAKLNAVTRAVLDGLASALTELEGGRGHFLLIHGQGDKAFCAGTDLAEIMQMSDEAAAAKTDLARDLFVRLSRSPVISVAAINGLAYGGGLELAMCSTFRVAAPHVSVSLPEIKLGVLPSYGGTQFLPALVGRARALDMMLTGRSVPAAEALAMGLLDRVVAAGESVLDAAEALARTVTGFSRAAVNGIRRCVEVSGDTVTRAGLDVEAAEARAATASPDAKEGIAAFLEKRRPIFNRQAS